MGPCTPLLEGVDGSRGLITEHLMVVMALNLHVLCTLYKGVKFHFQCPLRSA